MDELLINVLLCSMWNLYCSALIKQMEDLGQFPISSLLHIQQCGHKLNLHHLQNNLMLLKRTCEGTVKIGYMKRQH